MSVTKMEVDLYTALHDLLSTRNAEWDRTGSDEWKQAVDAAVEVLRDDTLRRTE